MALKLKQYTSTYSGLDAGYYMTRKAPIITIITNRNTGKTTNVFGWLIENKKPFFILTRYKNEQELARHKLLAATEYYGGNITWNKKIDAFVDGDGNPVGFIGSLSGAQDIKNSAERYREVEYIVFDEFLPADRRYIRESTQPGYELEALRWIVGSIRKGRNGEYLRDVKIILLANLVDALNPYLQGIYDSNGDSLLTIIARAVSKGQTNITHDDSDVFITVHIDKRFEQGDDALSRFIAGNCGLITGNFGLKAGNGGLVSGFLHDFQDKVKPRTGEITKQLKRPILCTGRAAMYRINLRTSVVLSGQELDFTRQVYYWTPSNLKASRAEDFTRIDLQELQHWYSDIVVKAEVRDFLKKLALHEKAGF